MTCDSCKNKITNKLKVIKNIKSVSFDGHIAVVDYSGKLNLDLIIKDIKDLGYYTDINMISDDKKSLKRTISIKELLTMSTIIILVVLIVNRLFGFNVFNIIPVIDNNITYAMLFVTGLLTSIHCVSMCGAINLFASASIKRSLKKPLLYNLGRLVSYTLIGGLVGLLGNIFQINSYIQGTIIIVASVIMFLISLNMSGLLNIPFKLPQVFNKVRSNNSFVIGLFNGFMPCGPLQAMQVYALSTGSFIHGALSMFIFCLGTIPLVLFVGSLSSILKNKKVILNKISTVLILLLSVVMLNRGLTAIGVDITRPFKPNYDNYLKSQLVDDYQIVEFDLSYSGYKNIVIQKGIPVKMVINVQNRYLTGCNNSLTISKLNVNKELKVGSNTVEFTPDKTGTYNYTCWMGMLKNTIVVIDDINYFSK